MSLMKFNWITRPNLSPLNLDLKEFESDGAFQFKGFTTQGREVYAKYRMGWLTIMLCNPDEVLLEAKIGPDYHGQMLAEQVCDLAGMTLNGTPVVISEAMVEEGRARELIFDWSGRMTYLMEQVRLTSEAEAELREAITAGNFGWSVRLSMRHFGPNAKIIERPAHFDRPVHTPKTASGTLHVEFETQNVAERDFYESFIARRLFNRIEIIDIKAGLVTDVRYAGSAYSRDLIDWCDNAANRYISAYNHDQAQIGIRPAKPG